MGIMRQRAGRRIYAAALVSAVAALTVVAGAPAKPSNNPPGANGTVKIDGQPFDTHPDNQPHIGCIFQVDFYGFDEGPYNATVKFDVIPPSGRREILTDTFFIGHDPAGGGTDLDAESTYNLNMEVFASERHRQGFHIKLTVLAPGEGGKVAKKTKVFWMRDCVDP